MPSDLISKRLLCDQLFTRRRIGRPKLRWKDGVWADAFANLFMRKLKGRIAFEVTGGLNYIGCSATEENNWKKLIIIIGGLFLEHIVV